MSLLFVRENKMALSDILYYHYIKICQGLDKGLWHDKI